MDQGLVLGFIFVPLGIALYMLPAFVAAKRKCKAGAGIVIVDLLLGWTLIGWVVALAWAVCGEVNPKAAAPVLKAARVA